MISILSSEEKLSTYCFLNAKLSTYCECLSMCIELILRALMFKSDPNLSCHQVPISSVLLFFESSFPFLDGFLSDCLENLCSLGFFFFCFFGQSWQNIAACAVPESAWFPIPIYFVCLLFSFYVTCSNCLTRQATIAFPKKVLCRSQYLFYLWSSIPWKHYRDLFMCTACSYPRSFL